MKSRAKRNRVRFATPWRPSFTGSLGVNGDVSVQTTPDALVAFGILGAQKTLKSGKILLAVPNGLTPKETVIRLHEAFHAILPNRAPVQEDMRIHCIVEDMRVHKEIGKYDLTFLQKQALQEIVTKDLPTIKKTIVAMRCNDPMSMTSDQAIGLYLEALRLIWITVESDDQQKVIKHIKDIFPHLKRLTSNVWATAPNWDVVEEIIAEDIAHFKSLWSHKDGSVVVDNVMIVKYLTASSSRPTTLRCRHTRLSSFGARINARRLVNARLSKSTAGLFRRPRKFSGGSIVIDASGSMQLKDEDIAEAVKRLPAATIAYYCGFYDHETGLGQIAGELCVIAHDLRYYNDRLPSRHSGNDVDLWAIKWLLKNDAPRILVSDTRFCGGPDGQARAASQLLAEAKKRGDVMVAPTLQEAIRMCKDLGGALRG